MHQCNLVYFMGSLVGSTTTVVSREIRQQSGRVAIKHHAPTDARLISRWHQGRISSKKINKKASLILYRVLLVIYKALWLRSLSSVAVLEISRLLA